MAKWTFEPGHTAAEFRARHMMVTYVRGHFKDVHGSLEFDSENPRNSSVEVKIDARNIWTGVKERDDHLRSADFLDVERHPEITFKGNRVEIKGDGVNKGPKTRAGFVATTKINRQDFGVSWQDTMDRGGIVVGNEIDITIDAEAILEDT